MKKLILALTITISLTSCKTRIVDQQKPMTDNSLELYQKYNITTTDATEYKLKVVKIDKDKIYGLDKNQSKVELNRSDIYEVKKVNWLTSIALGVAAIAAVIFIPI